jgi:glycosyltransferase involved in cell wall biosynthesis
MQALACALGIAEVTRFAGNCSDVGPQIRESDVLVLSTNWESFGVVLVEAMLCGTLVCCSRVPGVAEVVSHLDTGLLFRRRSPEQLAGQLRWFAASGDEAGLIRARAQARALELFTAQTMAARFGALVEPVLSPSQPV